ncbi:MAG: hypothetical protein IT372_11440, partial [Polyangiaceae bacterium]|nr:hypothetical protein [Polyangiaceae bacterium]
MLPRRPRKDAPGLTPGSPGRRRDGIIARLAAIGVVGGLAVAGPLVEGGTGGGRGLAIGFLLMVIAPSLVRAGGVRFHPLDPETFVPLAYFLSAGYSPILHLLLSSDFTLTYAEINAFQVAYLGAVGCALICAGFSKVPHDSRGGESTLSERLLPRDYAVIATGLAGAGLVGVWIGITGVGRIMTASYVDTYQYEEGKGLLVSGWYFIQLAIVYCAARAADIRLVRKRVPRILYAAMGAMLVVFMMNTLLGRRGPILWVLFGVAICMHLSAVKIRRVWMAVAAGAVVIYAFAIEGYRSELGQGPDASFAAAQANVARIENP